MRGLGYGRPVMLALHDLARERGVEVVTLAAQLHAIGFYESWGTSAHGAVFLDAGIRASRRWIILSCAVRPVDVGVPETVVGSRRLRRCLRTWFSRSITD